MTPVNIPIMLETASPIGSDEQFGSQGDGSDTAYRGIAKNLAAPLSGANSKGPAILAGPSNFKIKRKV